MENAESFSLRKRLKSFTFALKGIRNLIFKEHNSRIHFVALICVIVLGIFLEITITEWLVITIVSGLVFLSELFNSAIEQLSDFVEPRWNDKIGTIKDYCAGAVLISALISLIVGGLIFIPKLIYIIENAGFI